MSILEAVLMGIIQGLSEFLPVSSSGHLALARVLFNLEESPVFLDALLHLGTLVAVLVAFRNLVGRLIVALIALIRDVFTGRFHWISCTLDQKLMIYLMASCLPLFIILPLKDKIESLSTYIWVVGLALIVNSVILFVSDYAVGKNKTTENMKFSDAFIIGFVQTIAVLPGISRSGSTITAGVARGLDRKFAAEFSFILSIPTILAGAVVGFWDAISEDAIQVADLLPYGLAALTAAVVGFGAIKLLEYLLKSKKFFIFAVYSFAVGLAAVIIGLIQ